MLTPPGDIDVEPTVSFVVDSGLLGTGTLHLWVQMQRRSHHTTDHEVASAYGILRRDREIGLFVSSAGFAHNGRHAATKAVVHIGHIDREGLLDLWIRYYDRPSQEDRMHLRLSQVRVLAAGVTSPCEKFYDKTP